ncbi:unnamed protein product [Darwinula stevensoni]|uniref:Uncharacterized protein n=1 Tax=Darwinula stevensoni TaxID=69355 RepID=A0A7R9FR61_9CRUS|nr:unnamed protein product [Darwinula stevensoni]CAG0900396.1 unnamed protein product [Darwinula stevensoni]
MIAGNTMVHFRRGEYRPAQDDCGQPTASGETGKLDRMALYAYHRFSTSNDTAAVADCFGAVRDSET